ncbi:hypothetical protein BKA70DRAFT_1491597 [Coprinopsis sp. MPI-PUGE-AT-0042]|nr:hypothetical protein BKA70DRAFT_1491597 [Coprinopsis sp. MPI-PUGE-AT-0042]
MAPERHVLPEGFQWVDEATHREVICNICAKRPGTTRSGKILWTSRGTHLKGKGHRERVEQLKAEAQSAQAVDQCQQPPVSASLAPIVPPAKLKWTIESKLLGKSHEPEEEDVDMPEPLQGVLFSEGRVFQDGDEVFFSAGVDPRLEEAKRMEEVRTKLSNLHLYRNDMCDASNIFEEPDDNAASVDHGIHTSLQSLGIEESDDEFEYSMEETLRSTEWSPYGSKTMCMLDMLDRMPRLRLSRDHLKAIIWVMRECGTPNVPTFSALRKVQETLRNDLGLAPKHHTSSLGNHFYMNHPSKLFALDFSNPFVRKDMVFYPEIDLSEPLAEFWQADKWTKEIPDEELSPMWCDLQKPVPERKHFYVNEITEDNEGNFVVPKRWVTRRGVVHAEAYLLSYSQEGQCFSLADPDLVYIPATKLSRNILDLKVDKSVHLRFSGVATRPWMSPDENPLRIKAGGKPMYRLRAMPWSDDVSGNRSKQYNAHTNIYIQNLNVPHKKLSQEYFVRFCSTSSYASSSEQFGGLVTDFENDIWHEAYDCLHEEEILFQIIPHILPADNPQQSEHASHIGGNGHNYCRRDTTGGNDEQKETDEGYCALFQPGRGRRPAETIDAIKAQVRLACFGDKKTLKSNASQSGVKDKISQHWIELMLSEYKDLHKVKLSNRDTRDPLLNSKNLAPEKRAAIKGNIRQNIQHDLWNRVVKLPHGSANLEDVTDLRPGVHYNPLLATRGINPHADTPVETLHTWLLGNNKYVWHDTTHKWSDAQEAKFAIRLQASTLGGLTTPPPRATYLVRYKNSLIGKHFKILQQLAVFHLHDLCSDDLFSLWKATGELGAMLWIPKIENLEEYLSDLQILVDNVLDLWAKVDPMRIVNKVKLHVLTHLVDDVRRFGPTILYSTEVFECWNAIFRLCSILSNHLAPSKDIAAAMAEMETFKHVVSGGWWKVPGGQYVQAGRAVHALFKNAEVQRRIGWSAPSDLKPGAFKRRSWRKQETKTAGELNLSGILESPPEKAWSHCQYIVARSGDICAEGSWVFAEGNEGIDILAGRIFKILVMDDPSSETVRVVLDRYTVKGTRHDRLNMPILEPALTMAALQPMSILYAFNAQHDCVAAKCEVTQSGPEFVRQERMVTAIAKPAVVHAPEGCYILNMHALHNAHLIRKTLPRHLVQPIPYFSDSASHRKDAAARLRVIGPQKRANTRKKAQETRARNKKASEGTTEEALDVTTALEAEDAAIHDDDTDTELDSDEDDEDEEAYE